MKKRSEILAVLGLTCLLFAGIPTTVAADNDAIDSSIEPTELQEGVSLQLKNILSNYNVAVESIEVDLVAEGLVGEYEDMYVGFENDTEFEAGYTSKTTKVRCFPSDDADVIAKYPKNKKIEYRTSTVDSDWCEIKYYDEEQDMDVLAYVHKENVSDHKNISCENLVSSSKFKNIGFTYYGGHKFTWYSQKVLSGGGLNIPGRHVSNGYVCDEEGYIVGASRDYAKGTVLDSPLGTQVKIYDWCEISGTIDIYCNY